MKLHYIIQVSHTEGQVPDMYVYDTRYERDREYKKMKVNGTIKDPCCEITRKIKGARKGTMQEWILFREVK